MECKSMKKEKPYFTLEMFDDYALIRGWLTPEMLMMIVKMCKKQGFTHLTSTNDGIPGFKLIKRDKE